MRYWWVNQNQTYRHEVTGGYLWSPKRNRNGGANPFYDSMREVALGDVVFSFADTRIKAIGVATGAAYEAPKPREFGETGAYWHHIGWRVDVRFVEVRLTIRPSERMDVLGPLLPAKYAPLQANGAGLQGVYLTRLPEEFAGALIDLIGAEARDIIRGHIMVESTSQQRAVGLFQWEEHVMEAWALICTTRSTSVDFRTANGGTSTFIAKASCCARGFWTRPESMMPKATGLVKRSALCASPR
jgi:putative restriction endonuclease